MKRVFTLLAMAGAFTTVFGQFPLVESFLLNTDGQLGHYEYYPGPPPTTTSVDMTDSVDCVKVCYDDNYVYIKTYGLADYTMGPWEMNPNVPTGNLSIYRIPRNPTEATGTHTANPTVGAMGVAINGVKMYGTGDARSYNSSTGVNDGMGDGLWNGDAWASEGATMDGTGGGHPDGGGNYHYHAIPFGLYDDPSSSHSPIVGWAFDGFPIYGPFGYTDPMDASSAVSRMTSSYQLRSITDRTILPDGSTSTPPGPAVSSTFPLGTYWEDYEYVAGLGDLDTFNGRFCKTPEFPSGIYAYFITTSSTGVPAYPYQVGPAYYGVVNAAEIGGPAGSISWPSTAVTCVDGTTGIEESMMTALVIYPNPANSTLNLNGLNSGNYEILDMTGNLVQSGQVQSSLDISGLNTGSYMIRISDDFEVSIARFIKE